MDNTTFLECVKMTERADMLRAESLKVIAQIPEAQMPDLVKAQTEANGLLAVVKVRCLLDIAASLSGLYTLLQATPVIAPNSADVAALVHGMYKTGGPQDEPAAGL